MLKTEPSNLLKILIHAKPDILPIFLFSDKSTKYELQKMDPISKEILAIKNKLIARKISPDWGKYNKAEEKAQIKVNKIKKIFYNHRDQL